MSWRDNTHSGRLWRWIDRQAYVWGLSSGGVVSWSGSDKPTVAVKWRGKRVYFLRWPRWKWRCLLSYRHWPTNYTVVFDFCGRCCPWPCCGSITFDHTPRCKEQDR